jgi:purine-nucleoside phosphorylase
VSRSTISQATNRATHRVAIVLGSGLGAVARSLIPDDPVPYGDLDGMPTASVAGHEGSLYSGMVEGVDVLVFAGRVHLYEGCTAREVVRPVEAAIEAGCDTVLLTNSAGGIAPTLAVGAPCLISDQLNLTGEDPLAGPHDGRGPRFLDLSTAYDPHLRALAREVDPSLQEGVYAGLRGPSYETPAEVRMLRAMGADLVGMSTVLETIRARYLGARVLGISVVTNLAAGLTPSPLSHEEVAERGRRAAGRLESLLRGVVAGAPRTSPARSD